MRCSIRVRVFILILTGAVTVVIGQWRMAVYGGMSPMFSLASFVQVDFVLKKEDE